MRDYTRKAKRVDNGEWVEGYLFFIADTPYIICDGEEMCMDGENADLYATEWYTVDENTICEPTGLTDKNGNKIWENDVVKYHFGNDVAPIRFGEYQSCFDSDKTCHVGFYVDWNSKKDLRKDLGYWVNMIDCNVIGNIFDNPELLESNSFFAH